MTDVWGVRSLALSSLAPRMAVDCRVLDAVVVGSSTARTVQSCHGRSTTFPPYIQVYRWEKHNYEDRAVYLRESKPSMLNANSSAGVIAVSAR